MEATTGTTSGWLEMGVGIPDSEHNLTSLFEVHSSILQAELLRRAQNGDPDNRQPCGTKGQGAYNTLTHVMALFLILILSTLACSFPILARRFTRLPIPRRFLFLSRHFGTGVLIATAFVHLLPTAFISLTDPCLPSFWSERYRAMAGFVAMISAFLVVCVEMIFAMKGAGHVHGSEYDRLMNDAGHEPHEPSESNNFATSGATYLRVNGRDTMHDTHLDRTEQNNTRRISRESISSPRGSTGGSSRARLKGIDPDDDDDDLETLDPLTDIDTETNRHQHRLSHSQSLHQSSHGEHLLHNQGSVITQSHQRQLLQCLLLEAGILFHSIFIGMAVSVATGTSFAILLVAISFHQTFEGFALGSRIASLIPDLFTASSAKPWLMCVAYGTTTPIGQALGLILHNFYDPASATGLLTVGLTNAVSSGLLLFAGLVELLAEDFLSESSYQTLRGRRRVEACLAVMAGALLMAFVGAFA